MAKYSEEVKKAFARRRARAKRGVVYQHSGRLIRDINADIRETVKAMTRVIAQSEVEVGRNMLVDLARATPVDTSTCQSNWTLTERRARTPFVKLPYKSNWSWPVGNGDYDYGNQTGPTLVEVSERARRDSQRVATKVLQGKKVAPVYISNSTPYLKYLDELGTSEQAVKGWVKKVADKAFREGLKTVNKVLKQSGLQSRRG